MNDQLKDKLNNFAVKHKVIFIERGEVGIMRPCVGFSRNDKYIDFEPYESGDPWGKVFPHDTEIGGHPKDSYHKHNCMAVLVGDDNYDEALNQLGKWVDHLEGVGVVLCEYKTGATGIQAIFSGIHAHCFRRISDVEGEKIPPIDPDTFKKLRGAIPKGEENPEDTIRRFRDRF